MDNDNYDGDKLYKMTKHFTSPEVTEEWIAPATNYRKE